MITQALAEFDEPKQAIEMVKSYGTLTLVDDGIGKVEQAHKQVKRLRIDIDSRRKSLNEGALTYQRTVNAEAKRLTAEIEPIETALSSQRQIHEEILLKEQQEKHAAKRAVLTARIEKLAQAGCIVNDVAALEAMSDDEFLLHCVSEIAKAVSLRKEQEAARKAAEDIEIARLAEIKRQSDEIRIRQAELDSERKAMAAEREAMQHQQQIERRALEEQQAEVRRQQQEIQREADRKTEAERQRVLAERKAEDERLAVIAAEQKEVARLARLEALKPEIEKAETFANRLFGEAVDILHNMGQPRWSVEAMESVRRCGLEVLMIARGEG
jgi:chromosome segregation ATPase